MKKRFKGIAYTLGILVCLICIGVSAGTLLNRWYHRTEESKLLEELQEKKQASETVMHEEETTAEETEPKEKIDSMEAIKALISVKNLKQPKVRPILPEYKALHEENNDMYGWIKIEGTVIDYPVMFTPNDPNFYEDKNWNKEICYASVGTCIWIDGWTTEDSENTIVYGHEMADYSMFGSLSYYKDPNYYESHKYIQFDTIYEKQTYEIISVSKGIVYYDTKPEDEYLFYEHIELDSEDEFNAYVSNAKQKGWYDIDTTAKYGDKLITLCTCDGWATDGRLFIVAKKIEN